MKTKITKTLSEIECYIMNNVKKCKSKRNTFLIPESGDIVRMEKLSGYVFSKLKFSYDVKFNDISISEKKVKNMINTANSNDVLLMNKKNPVWKFFFDNITVNKICFFDDFLFGFNYVFPNTSERQFIEFLKFWIYENGFFYGTYRKSPDNKKYFIVEDIKSIKRDNYIYLGNNKKTVDFFMELSRNEKLNCRKIYNRYQNEINETTYKSFFSIFRGVALNNSLKLIFNGKGVHKTVIII